MNNNSEKTIELTFCKNCGYPVSPALSVCPACQHVINGETETEPEPPVVKEPDFVIPPIPEDAHVEAPATAPLMHRIKVEPLPHAGDADTPVARSFSGETIDLTRDNTDPANHTISTGVQARLVNENGKWYIENPSGLPTTMVVVKKRTEVQFGDVIVLGNRLFELKFDDSTM